MAKAKDDDPFNVTEHILVPKHEKLSDKQKGALLEDLKIDRMQLPRIPVTDPAIEHLGAEEGDVIKIMRKSPTAGETVFYRIVTME